MPRGPRERDYVADISHSRYELHQTLEPETEARMRHASETAQVQVPFQAAGMHAHGGDARLQFFEVVLALRSADDLADAGHQHVHGPYRLAIRIQLHVESFDVLGIIRQ